ncbi:unnamed protein product, partial [Staurois parvus]
MMGHGTIPPTDNNCGALFLPLTPMIGHYSSHTDANDGALFLSLTPVMGTITLTDTNDTYIADPCSSPGSLPLLSTASIPCST